MTSTMGSLSPVETATVFGALSHPLRLRAVRLLEGVDASLAVKDLARELVRAKQTESEEQLDEEHAERVHVALHHAHVPRLADAGLVEYDESEQRVALDESVPLEDVAVLPQ